MHKGDYFSALGRCTLFAMVLIMVSWRLIGQEAAAAVSAAGMDEVRVTGTARGESQEQLKQLLARGVALAEADMSLYPDARQSLRPVLWRFSLQGNIGNRAETLIVGTMQPAAGEGHPVSGFFRSRVLGTSPDRAFIDEIRIFAATLIDQQAGRASSRQPL